MNDQESAFLLGKLDGKLDSMISTSKEQHLQLNSRLDGMDERLRKVEVTAAKAGAVSGSLVSIGIAFIAEGIKAALHLKT